MTFKRLCHTFDDDGHRDNGKTKGGVGMATACPYLVLWAEDFTGLSDGDQHVQQVHCDYMNNNILCVVDRVFS